MFAGSFPPNGWLICAGQVLPISENDVLFQLIGTTYGGDGQETFGIPDLRGRIPMHVGNNHIIGESGGTESVALTVQQIPVHTHALLATSAVGTQSSPTGNFYSASGVQLYSDPNVSTVVQMKNTIVGASGGSQPHENIAPYLCINFIISLYGLYPSPT
jgi:microcystin-dependent protein